MLLEHLRFQELLDCVELCLEVELDAADGVGVREPRVLGVVEHAVDWPERLVALVEEDAPVWRIRSLQS